MFYALILQFYLKTGHRKKKMIPEQNKIKKKTYKKQNSATIMISVDGKVTVFSMKLNLQGESFE